MGERDDMGSAPGVVDGNGEGAKIASMRTLAVVLVLLAGCAERALHIPDVDGGSRAGDMESSADGGDAECGLPAPDDTAKALRVVWVDAYKQDPATMPVFTWACGCVAVLNGWCQEAAPDAEAHTLVAAWQGGKISDSPLARAMISYWLRMTNDAVAISITDEINTANAKLREAGL